MCPRTRTPATVKPSPLYVGTHGSRWRRLPAEVIGGALLAVVAARCGALSRERKSMRSTVTARKTGTDDANGEAAVTRGTATYTIQAHIPHQHRRCSSSSTTPSYPNTRASGARSASLPPSPAGRDNKQTNITECPSQLAVSHKGWPAWQRTEARVSPVTSKTSSSGWSCGALTGGRVARAVRNCCISRGEGWARARLHAPTHVHAHPSGGRLFMRCASGDRPCTGPSLFVGQVRRSPAPCPRRGRSPRGRARGRPRRARGGPPHPLCPAVGTARPWPGPAPRPPRAAPR